jgi:hypothetical protein
MRVVKIIVVQFGKLHNKIIKFSMEDNNPCEDLEPSQGFQYITFSIR